MDITAFDHEGFGSGKIVRSTKINTRDNVAVAVEDCIASELHLGVILLEDIPHGHKFAIEHIKAGDNIIKYGYPIGKAQEDIKAGSWVHTHNVKTNLSDTITYTYEPTPTLKPTKTDAMFSGFMRPNGRAGVRNEIWIIPTVGCVNSIATQLEKQATPFITGSVNGVYAFPHPYGCSQMGGDHENTKKALVGLMNHPNAGGVLVLGLGCENNQIDQLMELLGDYDKSRIKTLITQNSDDELAEGLELLKQLIHNAKDDKRTQIDASKLIVGLKCGGSDGLSGITANPLIGDFSDKLIAAGGTTILTEVPEMFGAETILMNRCKNEQVFSKAVSLINDFKQYYLDAGQTIYENPSPGNKKGGITTLEDKSLGCTQKGGEGEVVDVLNYGESVMLSGLNLLSAPGNDLVASTALAVSGAQIVLFSTGRGTPFGCPVPTVKISSNTPLFDKKRSWIDFDAGCLTSGKDQDIVGQEFFDYVLKVASGECVHAEKNGYRDIAIFKTGVTL